MRCKLFQDGFSALGPATCVVAALAIGVACTAPRGAREDSPSQTRPVAARPAPRLDHLSPPRDFGGSAPKYFEWTPVAGADHYAIGIWNEIDMVVWRNDDVRATSVDWPADLKLEFGTYMWTVTALRGDVPLVDSGRSAFVISR